MNIQALATFLGWCTVINIGLLLLAGLFWIVGKDGLSKIVATMFGVTHEQVRVTFLSALMQYRAAIFVLNLVRYFALKIMA